jgi:tryptophan-rich sensory protein
VSPSARRPEGGTGGTLAILALTVATAAVGGLGSFRAVDFYVALALPSWAPPSTVFGPVWTALYALMAIAAIMVWRARGRRGIRRALALYGLQLVLNALWPWLFFTWRRGMWAFGEVALLVVVVAITVGAFWRVRRLAAVLLLPYLAWVTFASALTLAVWRLNPTRL